MDEDTIADLKQFIATTIAHQTSDLRGDMSVIKEDIYGIKGDIAGLHRKIDDLSASVAEALDATNEATDQQLKDHERRITRLEHKAA